MCGCDIAGKTWEVFMGSVSRMHFSTPQVMQNLQRSGSGSVYISQQCRMRCAKAANFCLGARLSVFSTATFQIRQSFVCAIAQWKGQTVQNTLVAKSSEKISFCQSLGIFCLACLVCTLSGLIKPKANCLHLGSTSLARWTGLLAFSNLRSELQVW